jgi:hypothetical protein
MDSVASVVGTLVICLIPVTIILLATRRKQLWARNTLAGLAVISVLWWPLWIQQESLSIDVDVAAVLFINLIAIALLFTERSRRWFGDMRPVKSPEATQHWTNALFAVYGILSTLVLGLLLGQLIFGSISIWRFAGFCLGAVMSFLAGAGTKGSLLIGTTPQVIAGSLLGALVIAGCLWIVHLWTVVIVVIGLNIPGELWIVVSALTGFLGATKWDALQHLEQRVENADAARIVINCPNCSQQIRVPVGRSGTIRCPRPTCRYSFQAQT